MARIGSVIRDVYRRPGAEEVPAHLERRYGITVTATTRLDAGVLRIKRDQGPDWVARLFVTGRPIGRAQEDAAVLRFLEERAFPAERCAHPEPVSELDGRAVLVTEFVEGRRLPTTPAARRRLGALVGRIHELPTEPGPSERPAGSLHHLPDYEGLPGRDLAAAAALLADLDGRVPAEHSRTYDSLHELLERGDDGAGLPESFLHPDPAWTNVIESADGPVLVDWTGAGSGPRLASLAVALTGVGRKQAAEVLKGYRSHIELTAEEKERAEGVMWIRPLWLACWQCWLAVVSPKVSRTFVPDAAHIAATAAQLRAAGS